MNYQKYFPVDVLNGPGTRCTLFLSGCEHQCRGCYNQSTWSPTGGHLFDDALHQRIIDDLNDPEIRRRGLTLTGGDPLHPANVEGVAKLIADVREQCPGKDIWLWTGYVVGELSPQQQAIVDSIDCLVDGKFEQDLADRRLKWRGSSNQKVYQIQDGKAVEMDLNENF